MKKRWFCALAIWMAGIPSVVCAQATPISACRATIAASGPYVLTANLTNPDNTAPCLTVNAFFVSIDLAGFTINGKGGSSGIFSGKSYLTISNGAIRGFTNGVKANGTGVVGIKLSNVRIKGSVSNGASLGDDATVENSQFLDNGGDGLDVGANALITRSTFNHNSIYGVFALARGAVIRESTAANNISHGIVVDGNATVSGNTAQSNGNTGFIDIAGVNGGSVFVSNASYGNSIYGFSVENSTVTGNVANGNLSDGFNDGGRSTFLNNTSADNSGDGFRVGSSAGSTLTGNTATGNGQWGFQVTCPTNLIGNTAYANTSGSETESGGPPACAKATNLFP